MIRIVPRIYKKVKKSVRIFNKMVKIVTRMVRIVTIIFNRHSNYIRGTLNNIIWHFLLFMRCSGHI